MNFKYNAKVIKVIDGDTVKLECDLGFRINFTDNFRLMGVDTPEIRGAEREAGLVSKEALRSLLADHGNQVICHSYKHGKYRWLADLTLPDGTNVSQWLIDNGHGRQYK